MKIKCICGIFRLITYNMVYEVKENLITNLITQIYETLRFIRIRKTRRKIIIGEREGKSIREEKEEDSEV